MDRTGPPFVTAARTSEGIANSPVRLRSVLPALVLFSAAVLFTSAPVETHYPVTTSVRFNREVAAVLNARCVSCHRDSGLAMPLLTYAQARPWAEAIKEEVLGRRMPPWSAERGYGAFANDGSLTPREREFLLSWIDGGAPEGQGTPPAFVDHSEHWMLGPPDHVYAAAPEQGSAHGPSPLAVSRFIVHTRERQAMSVRALDIAMPDRRAARSAFLSVLETGQYLGGWTPWHSAIELPPGAAFHLPPGARIAIDVVHAGSPRMEEPPQIALYAAPERHAAVVPFALSGESANGRVVRTSDEIRATHTLVAFRVRTSEGAESIELTLRRPDGAIEPLLWIPEFRPEWQTPYVLREPIVAPPGSVLEATARFIDSAPMPMRASVDLVVYESETVPPGPAPAHVH
jgi:hypothetical protein